ncbi:MAG: alpha-1,2-fucosyltransferase [Williamsia sp.]|nr:alpha-1,2-fucosyltransferase [Williamsia sp.]
MIIVKLISGLGNQLFQYAIGRQLSIKRGVPLKLDTSFFQTQHLRSYKLDHYNIQAEIASEEEVASYLRRYKSLHLADRIYRKLERQLPKQIRRYYKEGEWWGYEPQLLKAGGKVYLDGYWQHHRYFEHLYPQIREELTLKNRDASQAGKLEAEIVQNNSAVSLHIRRGDYLSDKTTSDFMGVLPLDYYHRAISYLGQKLPDPSYYVFSDDLEWAKENLRTDGSMQFVEMPGGNKDYAELDLMSKCRHNIIANSSFSWWGAFLNPNPGKIVIAPNKWVIPDDVNARIHLAFPSWIKL